MPTHDIIVIGASAGGVEALSQLVHRLPGDLPAAVFVVLHIPSHSTSVLPHILSRNGPLPAWHPIDGDQIHRGQIYIAPPDHHLLLEVDRIRLSRGPRENGHRPAVDPLFRTAARSYGSRVIGVVLSGTLDDGTGGLAAVKQCGGLAVVQDPNDALYSGMPRSAPETVPVDHCLPVTAIAGVLTRLAREPVRNSAEDPMPEEIEIESEFGVSDLGVIEAEEQPSDPSVFGCPDCGGTLWELRNGEMIRFRCRVGHAWTANILLAKQSEGVETTLWSALRALDERAALCNRFADRLLKRGNGNSAVRFREQARDSKHRAAILRQVLISEPVKSAEVRPLGQIAHALVHLVTAA